MITLGMFRTAVLFVTVVGGFGAACDVGSVLAQEGGGDGGGSGSGGTGSDCPAPTATPPTGHHAYNGAPGDTGETVTPVTAAQLALGCMGTGGCHNGSAVVGGIPTPDDVWDYAGVAYKDIAGTMPYAGATILLGTEAPNPIMYVQMTVGANGFFYHTAGIDGFPDPATSTFINSWICDGTMKTEMSQSLGAMSTQNTSEMTNDGNCNGGTACHGVAGSTGGEFIYLTPSS
jgi:hypothetical protein